MAKKKLAKKTKIQRRKKEALKAHGKSSIRGQFEELLSSSQTGANQAKKTTHRLNMKAVKLDLVKTFVFALLVIAFLLFLKSQNLEFDFGINK